MHRQLIKEFLTVQMVGHSNKGLRIYMMRYYFSVDQKAGQRHDDTSSISTHASSLVCRISRYLHICAIKF